MASALHGLTVLLPAASSPLSGSHPPLQQRLKGRKQLELAGSYDLAAAGSPIEGCFAPSHIYRYVDNYMPMVAYVML